MKPASLADATTDELADALSRAPCVALVPVGSLEPHGPHLPLALDTRIAEQAAARACAALASRGVRAWLAPSVAYGVTDCADGFAGAVGVDATALCAVLRSLGSRLLANGFVHVCFVNDHLEPAHDGAVRDATHGLPPGRASVASPLTKRWARTLSDEFKRGACHAGRYETSLALAGGIAVRPVYRELPPVETSLSRELAAGRTRFTQMGLPRAYAGAPAEATLEEGDALFDKHVEMIVSEVMEALAGLEGRAAAPTPPVAEALAEVQPRVDVSGVAGVELAGEPRRTYSSRDEMDAPLVEMLTRMMEGQAYRELAAARLFGVGLQFVPELKWLKFMTWHIREETEHYEAVARMYREFTGRSVEPIVQERLERQPPFENVRSWFELAMAQFLYDRGGYWQLREYEQCVFLPYRAVVAKIVKEEAGHQRLGERIVVELCETARYEGDKQACFEKWLQQGLRSFGRPGTQADRFAVASGLKKRAAAAVMQDFLDDIKPAVRACGLRFPEPARLALELPTGLDWSLEGGIPTGVVAAS